jgi:chromosome partitioning protein
MENPINTPSPERKTRVIAFSNRKGGSGKTTTAVNVSAALAHMGKRVLVVDADPQAHATLSLGLSRSVIKDDLYSFIANGKDTDGALAKTYLQEMRIIPASRRLTDFERRYSNNKEVRVLLARRLAKYLGKFDYICFDCAPTLSLLTISALIAANEVIVPMQAHFLALEGLAEMIKLIKNLQRIYNPEIRLRGIIPTFYSDRTRLSRAIISEITKNLGEGLLLHPVRTNISLAEAPSRGETIFQYNRKSHGAFDYLKIAQQIETMT